MELTFSFLILVTVTSGVFASSNCSPEATFTCNDGTCISIAKKCNGLNECPHGEDESSDRANCQKIRPCEKNENIAKTNGYPCRKPCFDDSSCTSENKRCLCDDECGPSCVKPKKYCEENEIPSVVNSTGHVVIRFKDGNLTEVAEDDGFEFGDMIRFFCPGRKRLVGPLLRCSNKGWSKELPKCIDTVCHEPPPNLSGSSSYHFLRKRRDGSWGSIAVAEGAEYGDEVTYVCEKGLILTGTRARCDGNQQWTSQTQICEVPCRERDEDEILRLNLVCRDECLNSYDCPSGLICYCDGHCGRSCVDKNIDCGNVTAVQNAMLSYDGIGIERIARYECNPGYYISSGDPYLICSGSGRWIGQIPSCSPIKCGDPRPSIGATDGWIEGAYDNNYNTTLQFRCRGNYKLLGSKTRTCKEDGQWDGQLTICYLEENDFGYFLPKKCPHPGVPINGKLIGKDFRVGSTVTFKCDPGYILTEGDQVQTCLWFFQWSGDSTPKCINPFYPHSKTNVIDTLSRSLSNLPDQKQNVARFISQTDTERKHEIYFVLDISKSVLDKPVDLKNEVEFAKRLVRRMEGFQGSVRYGIIVFAKSNVTVQDIRAPGAIPTSDEVVEKLDDTYRKAISAKYYNKTKSGTNTAYALNKLRDMITLMHEDEPENKRHVFIFTDGKHTEGKPPEKIVREMEAEFENIEFYSITACMKCNIEAFQELSGLSSKNGKNYIYIQDFYQLSLYLDKVTDVEIDFEKCGQAGDVGSVKTQAQLVRVVNGKKATENAWPWQALITKRKSLVRKIFEKKSMLGGGSLLNNHWVLTAAHLFKDYDTTMNDWFQTIVVTLGISHRPTKNREKLIKSARMYIPEKIIIHEDWVYEVMENDIALVKLGKSLELVEGKLVKIDAPHGVNYTYYIRPVCLPCTGSCLKEENGVLPIQPNLNEVEKCRVEENLLLEKSPKVVVTGFGHINISRGTDDIGEEVLRLPRYLQQALLRIVNRQRCKTEFEKIKGLLCDNDKVFTENMICCESGDPNHEDIDACQGDSGGPVVREIVNDNTKESCWVQIGIVSWGYGCGIGLPAFYTNVPRFIPWIENIIPGIRNKPEIADNQG